MMSETEAALHAFLTRAEDERDEARAEVKRLREALAPFRALADAVDTMGGFSDEEWVRVKERVTRHAAAAREALDARS